jgi:hypothetical protein
MISSNHVGRSIERARAITLGKGTSKRVWDWWMQHRRQW